MARKQKTAQEPGAVQDKNTAPEPETVLRQNAAQEQETVQGQNAAQGLNTAQTQNAAQDELTLDEAFAALDGIIGALESRDITLEESFRQYQKGMELVRACNEKIDTVEKKMLVLEGDGETYEF